MVETSKKTSSFGLKILRKKQMAPVQCSQGLVASNGTCYGPCPAASSVSTSDPSICVSTIPCQVGTIADISGLKCIKTDILDKVGDTCPSGYTEWTANKCYIDCTPYFVESGTFCAKNLFVRQSEAGWCSSVFDMIQGNACVFNTWLFVGILILFLFLLWFVFIYGRPRFRMPEM